MNAPNVRRSSGKWDRRGVVSTTFDEALALLERYPDIERLMDLL